MKWASAISEQTALEPAIAECVADLREQLGDAAPDLAVVFASLHYREGYDAIPSLVREQLGSGPFGLNAPLVLGCSGGGIIGNGLEVEQRPALSITAARSPRRDPGGLSPGGRKAARPWTPGQSNGSHCSRSIPLRLPSSLS